MWGGGTWREVRHASVAQHVPPLWPTSLLLRLKASLNDKGLMRFSSSSPNQNLVPYLVFVVLIVSRIVWVNTVDKRPYPVALN